MPVSFLSLKQEVARGYRLRALTQGTVPTGGNTTLFLDSNRQEPAGEFDRVDAFIKFTNGLGVASVNQYAVRRITGFSTGNQTLTFAPALTASVPSGTTYDIYKNFDPDTDHELAINSSIRDQFGARAVYTVATTVEPNDDTHRVTVPSAAGNTMTRLIKVERAVGSADSDYHWDELEEHLEYRIVNHQGALTMELQYPTVASTVLRLTGMRPSSELSADTDLTEEPAHLIVLGARKYLALQEGDKAGIELWGRELEKAKTAYYMERETETLTVPRFRVG